MAAEDVGRAPRHVTVAASAARGYMSSIVGREQQVDARPPPARVAVLLEGPRIGGEVLVRTELQAD